MSQESFFLTECSENLGRAILCLISDKLTRKNTFIGRTRSSYHMTEHNLVVFDAPSNLGLRPPEQDIVPGCYKLSWALRDLKLLEKLHAIDGGSLVPPRYHAQWKPGEGTRNSEAIASYSIQLANRLETHLNVGRTIIVLGGDCSILIGTMLALKRRGRYGLVYLDAHSDFRHPGNRPVLEAAAGEDLAIVTGRGDTRLINLEERGPYLFEQDIHIVGIRSDDYYMDEISATNINITTSQVLKESETEKTVAKVLESVTQFTAGFWIHLDLDVVDSSEMPAVDSPESNGLSFSTLTTILQQLIVSTKCLGLEVTIYDPDLDPTGIYAKSIVESLVQAFSIS